MTLKNKFKKQLDTATPTLNRPYYQAEQCEKIADKYAINFIKWIISQEAQYLLNDLKIVGEIDDNVTPEKLLEIYKKEKGL